MTHGEALSSEPVEVRSVVSRRRFRWRGAVGVVLLTPAALVTILANPLVTQDSWLDIGIDALAWVAFLAGAGFRFWATLYSGGRKSDFVVAEGPYSLCRHPLYLGSILLVLSGALFLKSLVFAAALAVLAVAYIRFTVPAEEEYLQARLGEPYREYCRRVNRLWPSFRHFQPATRITVDVHSLYLECARASRWIWLPLFGEVIGHLRAAPWWPRLFSIP
jgi:protein-S-isoprenylcysteine O-methyltransferase Ste14